MIEQQKARQSIRHYELDIDQQNKQKISMTDVKKKRARPSPEHTALVKSVEEQARYLKLAQQQQVLESIIENDTEGLSQTQRKWIMEQHDKVVKEKQQLPEEDMISLAHLRNLKLDPQQIQQLAAQNPINKKV